MNWNHRPQVESPHLANKVFNQFGKNPIKLDHTQPIFNHIPSNEYEVHIMNPSQKIWKKWEPTLPNGHCKIFPWLKLTTPTISFPTSPSTTYSTTWFHPNLNLHLEQNEDRSSPTGDQPGQVLEEPPPRAGGVAKYYSILIKINRKKIIQPTNQPCDHCEYFIYHARFIQYI